jgi:hypothetical protein
MDEAQHLRKHFRKYTQGLIEEQSVGRLVLQRLSHSNLPAYVCGTSVGIEHFQVGALTMDDIPILMGDFPLASCRGSDESEWKGLNVWSGGVKEFLSHCLDLPALGISQEEESCFSILAGRPGFMSRCVALAVEHLANTEELSVSDLVGDFVDLQIQRATRSEKILRSFRHDVFSSSDADLKRVALKLLLGCELPDRENVFSFELVSKGLVAL